jgi:SM-20-related protein
LIGLNDALDPEAHAARYARSRRMQIRDVLAPEGAEAVLRSLQTETQWGVAFNDGPNVTQVTASQAARLSLDQQRQILGGIHERARSQFQFFYNFYPLSKAYFSADAPCATLAALFEYLNGGEFLDFIRAVTGLRTIRWADAHATLYRAGHFLKYHTDENDKEHRLAAYVLNFTKDWGRDWGGYLQFFDAGYDIEQAYRPVFNALNLFAVPSDHSVGMVAAYAPGSRYSITGWFREDEPPGPIALASR